MDFPQDDPTGPIRQAEAVGRVLADAFIERVKRFPSNTRVALLVACRQRLLQDSEVAKLLLEGE